MKNITADSRFELSPLRQKAKQIPIENKIAMLRLSIEETEKYELLTTNQYLKHMVILIDILDDLVDK